MSGFEIAGVILGGFPILISACEHYKQGFEPLLRWKRFRREFISFINAVDTERLLFDQMMQRFLLSSEVVPYDEVHLFMNGLKYEGWHRYDLDDQLRQRLGPSYDAYMSTIETMNNLMLEMQSLLLLKNGELVGNGASRWDYQLKRVQLSFSKKGTRIVDSLEIHNRKLRELLDSNEKLDTVKAARKDTTWANIFECIKRHARSLHEAIWKAWCCECASHLTALRLESRITGDWTSKFHLAFRVSGNSKLIPQYSTRSACNVEGSQLRLEQYMSDLRHNFETKSSLEPNNDTHPVLAVASSMPSNESEQFTVKGWMSKRYSSALNVKKLNGKPCQPEGIQLKSRVIPTKPKSKKQVRLSVPMDVSKIVSESPTSTLIDQNSCTPLEAPITNKIQDLCTAIQFTALSNDCLGYLSDGEHDHELTLLSSTKLHPEDSFVSLDALLRRQEETVLTRQQRYRLASVLASSLLQLQTTQWLNEQMDKQNIFFRRQGPKILIDFPYIRHTFLPFKAHTDNPLLKDEPKPFAVRNSLANFGILLLELCFGQTIESQDIRKFYLGSDGKPHAGTDYMTARDWAEVVAEEEPAFEQIIKSCVFCMFEEKANWENKKFTQAVYMNVVKPLDMYIKNRNVD